MTHLNGGHTRDGANLFPSEEKVIPFFSRLKEQGDCNKAWRGAREKKRPWEFSLDKI
jgi:hypothetical protein